jgi:hypothetical protein
MMIFRAKKEKVCHYCRSIILRNDWEVIVYFMDTTGARRVFCYHADQCFTKHQEERFKKTWQNAIDATDENGKKKNPVRLVLGRPRKYPKDRVKKIRQLQSLVCYHKKAGNTELEHKAQEELEALTKG